jgi:hypothetical protein
LLELKTWNEVSLPLLDYFNRETWKTERFLKHEKKYNEVLGKLPKKLRDTLREIPISQLRKIPLDELKQYLLSNKQ